LETVATPHTEELWGCGHVVTTFIGALVALPMVGCGGPGVDAKAEESVERLDARDRAAAQVLVELEEASRDKDTARLCSRVYVYKGTTAGCEQAFKITLERDQVVSVERSYLPAGQTRDEVESGASAVAGGRPRLTAPSVRCIVPRYMVTGQG
jgi:hypothetical protein